MFSLVVKKHVTLWLSVEKWEVLISFSKREETPVFSERSEKVTVFALQK
jgi:hypothetical protein